MVRLVGRSAWRLPLFLLLWLGEGSLLGTILRATTWAEATALQLQPVEAEQADLVPGNSTKASDTSCARRAG